MHSLSKSNQKPKNPKLPQRKPGGNHHANKGDDITIGLLIILHLNNLPLQISAETAECWQYPDLIKIGFKIVLKIKH